MQRLHKGPWSAVSASCSRESAVVATCRLDRSRKAITGGQITWNSLMFWCRHSVSGNLLLVMSGFWRYFRDGISGSRNFGIRFSVLSFWCDKPGSNQGFSLDFRVRDWSGICLFTSILMFVLRYLPIVFRTQNNGRSSLI